MREIEIQNIYHICNTNYIILTNKMKTFLLQDQS